MNSEKFKSDQDKFTFLDVTARLSFKTASSLSLSLERHSQSLCPTRQIGWIDLHHPCVGHIKTQIRISLPTEYHTPEKFEAIVAAIFAAAEIPTDETYEALVFAESSPMLMAQTVNREGITDRI